MFGCSSCKRSSSDYLNCLMPDMGSLKITFLILLRYLVSYFDFAIVIRKRSEKISALTMPATSKDSIQFGSTFLI